jgi:hypothetical protein
MKGLHVSIVGCPKDIGIEVWVRPHGSSEALLDEDRTWSYQQLLFSGQGIEIKFITGLNAGSPNPQG